MHICSRKCLSSNRNIVNSVIAIDINNGGKIVETKKVAEGYRRIPTL